MGKRWWQGALGVQVCPPAHARLNPRWACFRHGDVGKKRKKKKKTCPHRVYGPVGRNSVWGGTERNKIMKLDR